MATCMNPGEWCVSCGHQSLCDAQLRKSNKEMFLLKKELNRPLEVVDCGGYDKGLDFEEDIL